MSELTLKWNQFQDNRHLFTYTLLSLTFFRAILGNTTEIVGAPYDTDLIAVLIQRAGWGHQVDMFRQPLITVLGYLFMNFGIPYRLGLEVLFLITSCFVATQIKRITNSQIGVICYLVLILNPYTLLGFTELQREPLQAIIYLLIFGLFLAILNKLRSKENPSFYYFLMLIALMLDILLKEGEEIFAIVLIIATFALLILKYENAKSIVVATCLGAIVFTATFTIVSNLNEKYYSAPGFRGMLTEYTSLLTTLQKIESGPTSQYAPITIQMLEEASKVSPSFGQIYSEIQGNDPYFQTVRNIGIAPLNEIDPSRMIWAIYTATNLESNWDQKTVRNMLAKSTFEIERAGDLGKISFRQVIFPYPVDPNFGNYANHILPSIKQLIQDALFTNKQILNLGPRKDYNPNQFNLSLNRRTYLVENQFNSFFETVRVKIIDNYHLILIMMTLLFYTLRRKTSNINQNVGTDFGPVYFWITSKLVVTGVIYACVAPNTRYSIFLSPLLNVLIAFLSLCVLERSLSFIHSRTKTSN
jgi:hypothetical protein